MPTMEQGGTTDTSPVGRGAGVAWTDESEAQAPRISGAWASLRRERVFSWPGIGQLALPGTAESGCAVGTGCRPIHRPGYRAAEYRRRFIADDYRSANSPELARSDRFEQTDDRRLRRKV